MFLAEARMQNDVDVIGGLSAPPSLAREEELRLRRLPRGKSLSRALHIPEVSGESAITYISLPIDT